MRHPKHPNSVTLEPIECVVLLNAKYARGEWISRENSSKLGMIRE